MAIDKTLIDQLLADYKKPEDIIGENGLLKQLSAGFIGTDAISTFWLALPVEKGLLSSEYVIRNLNCHGHENTLVTYDLTIAPHCQSDATMVAFTSSIVRNS
jgi:hypothetical protein